MRHLFAALDLAKNKLHGHIKPVKEVDAVPEVLPLPCAPSAQPMSVSRSSAAPFPQLTTEKCRRGSIWAAANNVEIAYTPTNPSCLNRIEVRFTALRCFTLDGADHATHKEQGSMIRRYIIWRNRHADDRAYAPSSTERTLPDAALAKASPLAASSSSRIRIALGPMPWIFNSSADVTLVSWSYRV
ncbi:hypothetical protein GCM10010405_54040 [Streptomyces macrosporus]|uniref:Transposase n=1 Tax=Streptomyces macrosporus TaxID=44032 RepID=A0ABN3KJC8_9ACTN